VELHEDLREHAAGQGLVGHRAHGTPFRSGRSADLTSASAGRGERPAADSVPTYWSRQVRLGVGRVPDDEPAYWSKRFSSDRTWA
jgi:hypothetical protein